jgi:hypothetical protein
MAPSRRSQRSMLAGIMCALALLAPSYAARSHPSLAGLPRLVLWAWERPEDLRGLDRDVAVAFLAQTIDLKADGLQVSPRRQPLRVDPETLLIAVTRVATTASSARADPVVDRVARAVAGTAALPGVKTVQIDFDAVQSESLFYRQVLRRVKAMLDARTPLSMTALASWCVDDICNGADQELFLPDAAPSSADPLVLADRDWTLSFRSPQSSPDSSGSPGRARV